MEKLAGQAMLGLSVSCTVIIWIDRASLWERAEIWEMGVTLKTKPPPTKSLSLVREKVRLVSQLSPAVPPAARNAARLAYAAGTSPAHCTAHFSTQATPRFSMPCTVLIYVHSAKLLQSSVTR